jgi:hypothetical protein
MTTPSSGPGGFDNPQANLGGADAVEKTSYVTGRGSEPEAPQGQPETRRQAPRAGKAGGMSPAGWVLILIAVLVAVYFGFAIFR